MTWCFVMPECSAIINSGTDAQSAPQPSSASNLRMAGVGVALTAKYSQKPGFHEKARYNSCTQRRIPASS